MLRMSRTLKDFVFVAVMFLMMQFLCRICSVSARVLCVGSRVLDACVLTAAAKGEAGDRREEDFVVIFDRVKDGPQSAHLFRNETIRGVNNLAQHVPTPPPPHS